jgi:carbon storage regulator CsrA
MLVLTRKSGQKLMIGEEVRVIVVGVEGGRVTLGIEAPFDRRILRGELVDLPEEPIVIEVPADNDPTCIPIPTKRIPPR